MKLEQIKVEKIAYCNLWGMQGKNATEYDLLKEMESYEDNTPVIQLYCSYKYINSSNDLDDSSGNSPFIRKIYNILWGRKDKKTKGVVDVNGYTNFSKTFIFDDVLMGGETLNTMQSYIKSVFGYKREYLKKRYVTDSAFVENMLIENGLEPTCESNFFIGNYVMVPAYFNGNSNNVQDRWVTKLPQLIDGWIYKDKFLISKYHDKDGINGYKSMEMHTHLMK